MKELLATLIIIPVILMYIGISPAIWLSPKNLQKHHLWLSPWFAIISIIFFSIVASLLGFPVRTIVPIFITLATAANIWTFGLKRKTIKINFSREIIFIGAIGASILLNISPLILRDKFMTTLSLGNNDVIAYATVSDYLVDHTIVENFHTDVILPISNLLRDGFRWGTPIIQSFFLHLLHLQGYQLTYVFQVILFALMIPLLGVFSSFFAKQSWKSYLLVSILTIFNANLLYMLYHNFFGQILYLGISVFLAIFFISYFSGKEILKNTLTISEILIGVIIAVFYFSYHEPTAFLLLPIILFVSLQIFQKEKFSLYFSSLLRIATISFLLSSYSIINATLFDFGQAFRINPSQPIGWQLFRDSIPYANPFEAMGFWSIHNFSPLFTPYAIVLSLLTLGLIFYGVWKMKNRLFFACFLLIFIIFCYWTGIDQKNFFAYNRALTYTLPFFIVAFVIGLEKFASKLRIWQYAIYFLLIGIISYSGIAINKRFIRERLSVDFTYISLHEIKSLTINEPIYYESSFNPNTPIWRQIWTGYFLYPHIKGKTYPRNFPKNDWKLNIPDSALVLISQSNPWIRGSEVLFSEILWKNDFYTLGRICNSDMCLQQSPENLSAIQVGENTFEDSLLIKGWGAPEKDGRWTTEKTAKARFVSNERVQEIRINALSLATPQELTLLVDGNEIGTQRINTDWNEYSFQLLQPSPAGLHQIEFIVSNLYSPADILGNADKRKLGIRVQSLELN